MQVAVFRTPGAQVFRPIGESETGRSLFGDDRADAFHSGGSVQPDEGDVEVIVRRARDEPFAAVQHDRVTVDGGGGFDIGDRGTVRGFGQGDGGGELSGCDPRQIFRMRGGVVGHHDDRGARTRRREQNIARDPGPHGAARRLDGQREFDGAEPLSAVFGGDGDSRQTHVDSVADHVCDRGGVFSVDPGRQRRPLLPEGPGSGLNVGLLRGEVECCCLHVVSNRWLVLGQACGLPPPSRFRSHADRRYGMV